MDLDKIVARAQGRAQQANVYFSAHLFDEKQATKLNVLPSRTIQADLDDAAIPTMDPPTVLVETSPNRHQGFWVLKDVLQPNQLEALSQQVTYMIPDSDHSGWSLGHRMRLPGTLNHKYSSGPKVVKVISASPGTYANLRAGRKQIPELESLEDWTPIPLEVGPRELWTQIKSSLPRRVVSQFDVRQQDRSTALGTLMFSLFRTGLTRDQVYWVAKASANNKWADSRYHGDEDLAKDVLRVERQIKSGAGETEDIRGRVMEARRLPGIAAEKRAYIAFLVRDALNKLGTFVASNDGQEWYVREDTGRPIPLTKTNDSLSSLLEIKFGLNATEPEQRYTVNSLISTTKERGRQGKLASLSYYDRAQELVLLHTGRRDVLHIDTTSISSIANGQLSIVFPWRANEEPFDPDLEHPLSIDTLFEGCFDNLNDMQPAEAMAIIKAWFYFLFFRDDATGRPILALFGQPGSGKSTLFRRIYTLLYGSGKAVNSVTSAEDFDHAVSNDPLVVFDNVDTWVSWLPDKLALSASTSDLVKRKLYTDSDTITLKRQALVGLTAHNPKFRREDIVDRLLILSLHRLTRFRPETDILNRIVVNRDRLWGGVVCDIQKILAQPEPDEADLPRFRVSDFARIGLRIARALGFEADFVASLTQNVKEQTAFNLEEEDILIETIKNWVGSRSHNPDKYYSVGNLWTLWQALSDDPQNFTRMYKNAVVLGKKLWTLQETLNAVFRVTFEFDEVGGRSWKFVSK